MGLWPWLLLVLIGCNWLFSMGLYINHFYGVIILGIYNWSG